MNKSIAWILVMMLVLSVVVGCAKDSAPEKPTRSSKEESTEQAPSAKPSVEEPSTQEPPQTQEESSETPTQTVEDTQPAAPLDTTIVDNALDGNLYNTKENPVPLGQWAHFIDKNYTNDAYEPIYMRIVRVSRDPAEVAAAIEAYDGFYDLTLTEEQAIDIEFGYFEYEYYYAPDYTTDEYGIYVSTETLYAEPIETSLFETDEGLSYFGVGSSYGLDYDSDDVFPGDNVSFGKLFTILKNYDESEYVIEMSWYDGEIETENERVTYFALSETDPVAATDPVATTDPAATTE
ncbi:MAG: hypothetical protein LBM60_06275 [Clostridium sp.]|jgi:hypothetical protein|nr:hypothetical protein [Clostridium sp.]